MKANAIVFDVFGTLIVPAARRQNTYARLADHASNKTVKLRTSLLTRNDSIGSLAAELGCAHLRDLLEFELAAENAAFRLYDDVDSTLRALRSRGTKIAVCSNLAAGYGEAVRRILPAMDSYVFSYEVGALKPDPRIYAAVHQALACRARDILVIGDGLRADVEGPLAYGMQARLLDRDRQSLKDVLGEAARS